MNYEETDELCTKHGYTLECFSPLEIRHEDGSFATLNAAEIVLEYLKANPPEQE